MCGGKVTPERLELHKKKKKLAYCQKADSIPELGVFLSTFHMNIYYFL